jgi:extracellular elastinolytic metalloproteinase
MKLQICRPTFFDARDAIIQADQVLTGGENFCTLWEGFASRGLGQDATVVGQTPWGGGIRTNVSLFLHLFTYEILTVSFRDMPFLWLAWIRLRIAKTTIYSILS